MDEHHMQQIETRVLNLLNSSPYQSLLHTNYAARGNDEIRVRQLSSDAVGEAARIEVEIQAMQKRLSNLQQLADSHKALLAPMRLVPDEIVQEIFTFVVESDWVKTGRGDRGRNLSPAWVLSRVCSRWRTISIGMPRLWSFVTVSFSLPGNRSIPLFEAHIARSRQLLMSLKFRLEWQDSDAIEENAIYRLFIPHFPRVQHLIISSSDEVDVSEEFPKYSNTFEALTTLELGQITQVGTSFADRPHLRKLVMALPSWTDFTHVVFPWSQLTSLTICANTGDFPAFFPTLAQARALEELCFIAGVDVDGTYSDFGEDDDDDDDDDNDGVQPTSQLTHGSQTTHGSQPAHTPQATQTVHFEHLRYLGVTMNQKAFRDWGSLIPGCLVFPRLQSLVLHDMDEALSEAAISRLCSAIEVSRCQINTVCLGLTNATDRDRFRRLLLAMPHIQTLTVQISGHPVSGRVSASYVAELLEHRTGERLLPCLTTFKLKCHRFGGSGKVFVDMLGSRDSPPIKDFALIAGDDTPSLTEEDLATIQAHERRGRGVSILKHTALETTELCWSPNFW